jgi:Domain of unknown function (DUF222)
VIAVSVPPHDASSWAGSSWADAAAAVAASVDALAQIPPTDLDGAQLTAALKQAAVQASRLHAVAARIVEEADARKIWRTQGAASLRGWVRRCVQLADDTARLVAAARMKAYMPRMWALFSAGQVSLAQMGTAARQVRRLPDGPEWPNGGDVGPPDPNPAGDHPEAGDRPDAHTDRALDPGGGGLSPAMWGDLWSAADDILAERAHAADARTLAALGEQIYAAADPGGHLGEELSHRQRRCLSISRGFEGMGEVAGRLDPQAAERAITVLNALARKSGPDDDRTAAQRRADAFDTLCKSWLESGNLPAPKDGRPRRDRVIVTIPYRTLMGLRGAPAAVLSSAGSAGAAGLGTAISAQAARRIACDASIRRVVVAAPDDRRTCFCGRIYSSANGDGVAGSNDPPSPAASSRPARSSAASGTTRHDPTARLADALRAAIASLPPPLGAGSAVIDVGRSVPTFTQPMRDALHAQYGGRCTFTGCDQPSAVDHHLIHWANGGPTSVANGAPLCEYHHYLVHEGGWRLQKDALGRITTAPPPLGWRGPSRHWRSGQPITGPPPDPHSPGSKRSPDRHPPPHKDLPA